MINKISNKIINSPYILILILMINEYLKCE